MIAPCSRTSVIDLIKRLPGVSDLEISQALFGPAASAALVSDVCRELWQDGTTKRRLRPDGLLGNHMHYPSQSFAGD